jgi:hypothetical protein
MENRPEPRQTADLTVRIWGMGADGAFFQNVLAHNISSDGALLSGVEHKLTAGDVIGVQLADKKARCRVVWVIDAGPLQKIQLGVQLLEGQDCPWKQNIASNPAPTSTSPPPVAPSGRDKRRFTRHRIHFPLELRDDRSSSSMQTSATDISGRGCYVETLMPLPFGTTVKVTFWMAEEKISTSGVVRASDPGVGMGIEFTGLEIETQQRFQKLIETLDPGFAGFSTPESGSTK